MTNRTTAPKKRSAKPAPPKLRNDVRHTEYPDYVLFVENDYRHKDAWLQIDYDHVHPREDMA